MHIPVDAVLVDFEQGFRDAAQPIQEMAAHAAGLIIARIEGASAKRQPEHTVFPAAFIRRESIGPA